MVLLGFISFITCHRSCWKVMFLQVSVRLSVHRGTSLHGLLPSPGPQTSDMRTPPRHPVPKHVVCIYWNAFLFLVCCGMLWSWINITWVPHTFSLTIVHSGKFWEVPQNLFFLFRNFYTKIIWKRRVYLSNKVTILMCFSS